MNEKISVVHFNIDQQCPIQYVTVYNDRAEVTRSVSHHFDNEGTYDLVFADFSPSVDLTSFHVSGGTGKACTILEVSHQVCQENTVLSGNLTPLDQLQNELDQVQEDIDKHQQELTRLGKQRTWLDGRASVLMNQDGQVNVNDLDSMQQFLEFYYKRLSKLDDETMSEEKQLEDLTQRRNALQTKINEYGAEGQDNRRKTKREVTITVHVSSSPIDIALEISYLISNCSWTASYDVRINSTETAQHQTQLTYYGIIVNQSQEDWSNVHLSLSTAMPSLGGVSPKLRTLAVSYKVFNNYRRRSSSSDAPTNCLRSSVKKNKKSLKVSKRCSPAFEHSLSVDDSDSESSHSVNVLTTRTETSMSSTSFTILRPATIDADGKPHKVTIDVLNLTSTFTYTIVPKSSTHAFLKASTTNTSDKQLLAGPVSVFMNNNFITHSSIDSICSGDTFDLPLGADASVKVTYKPVKQVNDIQGLLSKVNIEHVRLETHLVNTKSSEVIIFVHEQVPLSSNEKIKVKVLTPDLRLKDQGFNRTVKLNEANNLEWKCILPSHGECSLPLEYTVEWPMYTQIEYINVE
ncbi:unnamed protein product [Adineta ricciae]|uniref:Mucoidy inhibitor A n=1 Tax=Adineta ricciae TaxID=249248 RepID=A0A814W0F7_ADIRI|nr:unnamed protein product [Adineta ricciae]